MIIVSGLRSGTSLTMQTLKHGMDVTGFLFHDDFSNKPLNPRGYYSLPMGEIIYGINHHEYKGTAIKLGGAELAQTTPEYVDKIVWCRRNPEDCIKSIHKLLTVDLKIIGLKPTIKNATFIYYKTTEYIMEYIKEHRKSHIEIYFEEYFLNPERVVNRLNMFLDINIDKEKAIDNIIKREVICQRPQ